MCLFFAFSHLRSGIGSSEILESVASPNGQFVAIREYVESENTELVYIAKTSTGYDNRQLCVAVLGPQDDKWRIKWNGNTLKITTPKCIYLRYSTNAIVVDGTGIAIILNPGEQLDSSRKRAHELIP